MSPESTLVAKVVSHRDLERQVIFALGEFGQFEFIDVRLQAQFIEVRKTREEETGLVALEKLVKVMESLGLDPERSGGQRTEIDDSTLTKSLDFAAGVMKAIEIEVLEIDKRFASATIEIDRQISIRDVAGSLRPLGLDMGFIGTTEYTFTTAGILPTGRVSLLEWSMREVTDEAFAFRSRPLDRGVSVVSISVAIENKNTVQRILSAMGYEEVSVFDDVSGSPEYIAQAAILRIEKLQEELKKLSQRKDSIKKNWGLKVAAAWEVLRIEKDRLEAKNYVVYTPQSVKVWGWIPAGSEQRLITLLRKRTNETVEISFERPDFAELESPTYLVNPSVMKPAEEVVTAYGTPSKKDLDPTKILFFTFPLIFGLIFADVGQGFLILLIGLAAWRARRKGEEWGSMFGYLQTGAIGLVMMGLFSMLGGFLFGSFFGSHTVVNALWPVFAHTLENGEPNPWRTFHMLKLSIEIGVLQISLGIILNLYNRLQHRNFRGAFVALSYLWLYLGFANLLLSVSYNNIEMWLSETGHVNFWIPFAGIGFGSGDNGIYPQLPITPMMFTLTALLLPMVVMAIFSMLSGIDGMVEFMEYAIGMISHTVSYARIFALNTVHVILSGVFFTLIPSVISIPFPTLVLFGLEIIPSSFMHDGYQVAPHLPLLGAIIGTIIVGVLEGLLAFMHTLRLHYVEWFSKFYHGNGIPFRPFVIKRIHTVSITSEVAQSHYPVP